MLSVGQIFTAIGGLILLGGAVVWGVVTFTIGGLRDDVSAIRADLGSVRVTAEAAPQQLNDAQLGLTKEIQGLRVDLTSFRGDFKALEVSIDEMKNKVDVLYKEQKGRP